MIGWILLAFASAIAIYILAVFMFEPSKGSAMKPVYAQADGSKHVESVASLKTKSDVEITERDVFAKADLIQKMVQGMTPMNGAAKHAVAKPIEPVDPETQPPDETAFMKAITDKVEQIKRLSKKQNIG